MSAPVATVPEAAIFCGIAVQKARHKHIQKTKPPSRLPSLLLRVRIVARQAPSVHEIFFFFFRQEYWSGFPLSCSPGEFSQPKNGTHVSCITGGFFYADSMILHLNTPRQPHWFPAQQWGRRVARSQWEQESNVWGGLPLIPGLSLSQYHGPGFLKTRVQKFCKE